MSVHQLKDGRWIVKIPDPSKKSGSRREYFGRGATGEARARDNELDLRHTRPRIEDSGPLFSELAALYMDAQIFPNKSRRNYKSALELSILPHFRNVTAISITFSMAQDYIAKRRENVKINTICREINLYRQF